MIDKTRRALIAATTSAQTNETDAQKENDAIQLNSTTDMRVTEPSLLLDEKQTSLYLGISLSFLRKARSEGAPGNRTPAPQFVRVGGRCLYRRIDLDNWVNNLESQRVC